MQSALKSLAEGFAAQGGALYLVGGAVRSHISGLPLNDLDICGDLPPEEAVLAFERAGAGIVAEYAGFGTLQLHYRGKAFEYTAFRCESYRTGHRPDSVRFTRDMNEDAQRRDFTIGCLYLNILTGQVMDPTGYGLSDLQSGVLRTVSGAQTLREDGLRLLRLARFAAQLGFVPAAGLMEIARDNVNLLMDIMPERCRDELEKLLLAADPAQGLRLFVEMGAHTVIFPELPKPNAELVAKVPPTLSSRWAALHWPHPGASAALQRLYVSRETCKAIAKAGELAGAGGEERMLLAASEPKALAIAADMLTAEGDACAAEYAELAARHMPASERELPVSSEKLMAATGLPPGKRLGDIKRALWRYAVLENIMDEDALLERARRSLLHGD